jgi:hypothetical protein
MFKNLFSEMLTGFYDFLNANNSETAQASLLKLRLLRGLQRNHEPVKSEKNPLFKLATLTVSRGVG